MITKISNKILAELLRLIAILLLLPIFYQTFAREPHHDIVHYDLNISPDFIKKTITLTATLTILNPQLQDTFYFGLNDGYRTVKVTSPDSPVFFKQSIDWIEIDVLKPTEKMGLTFELYGAPGKSSNEPRDVISDSSLFLLWSDRFYPIDFNDWATVRTTIVLPAEFLVIAPGKLVKTRIVNDKLEHSFETTVPNVCYSIFADSRWIKTEKEINGIKILTLLHSQSNKYADQIFNTSSEILKFYSDIYCPYPFDQFAFVTFNDIYTRRAFPGFIGYSPEYLEKEFTTTGHDVHETALLWWCYTIRGKGPGSFQWTEGFGDYAEFLYDEKFRKPIPRIFQYFRDEYLKVPIEQDLHYTELGNAPQKMIHGKYPWLMHIIRYVAGEDRFINAMRLVFERFRFRTFSMDEFIATLEQGLGQSLKWWRGQWLERKGVPEIVLDSQIMKNNESYLITITLEQLGNVYHFPVEIGIETQDGLRIEKVNLDDRKKSFTVESPVEPQNILLDPNGWILMKKVLRNK